MGAKICKGTERRPSLLKRIYQHQESQQARRSLFISTCEERSPLIDLQNWNLVLLAFR